MQKVGLLRTALENGPMMAPFGTKLFKTTFKDRLEGFQIAWEANKHMESVMKRSLRELYWERFLDGYTPFANDVNVHGSPLNPDETLHAVRALLHKPIANPWKNIADIQGGKWFFGDEGEISRHV
jgi:hypothetical protein